MIKYFENKIVLTSQNPESFLVFGYDNEDYTIYPRPNFEDPKVWINGWNYQTINDNSAGILLDSSKKIAPFHIYTTNREDFDYNLSFTTDASVFNLLNFTTWDDSNWSNQDSDITGGEIISTDGSGYFISNTFVITEDALVLEASIYYENYSNATDPIFIIYESLSGTDISTSFNISSWVGLTNFSFSLDPSTTSMYFKLFSGIDVSSFDFNIYNVGEIYNGEEVIADVSIYNRPFKLNTEEFNTYENFDPLVDNQASYLLLRTNPKYSGNIKLVVDEKNNLFLDTFKVSDILSNKKYRKQKVSGNSVFSGDLRTVFSSLPSGEIFRLSDEDILDVALPKTSYSEQYDTTYDYGARMLNDELYDEDYSILAPLWVNTRIPDHFVLFKLNGPYNKESYSGESLDNLAVKYITDGTLLKSWSLKDNSPLGTYLNNHLTELVNVEAPVNLSLNDEDPNTWTGIAIDRGIITPRSEIPYFFEKITSNFTETNAFVSQGFERLNLICPNLINMEFVFDDSTAQLYTMSRYYGFYVSENELYRFSYYSDSSTSESFRIISLDGRDVNDILESDIFINDELSSSYKNRLFVRNAGDSLERVTSTFQIDGSKGEVESFMNKLGDNIFSTKVEKIIPNPFITLTLNTDLVQGEHLRVIDKTTNRIWEIYSASHDILNPGEGGPYVSVTEENGLTIYRTAFSSKGSISDQVKAIETAFKLFSDYENVINVGTTWDTGLSLIIADEYVNNDFMFQRITGQIKFPVGDANGVFNNAGGNSDITFFGTLIPDASNFNIVSVDSSYGPINWELYGDRRSIFVDFAKCNLNSYSFIKTVTDSFTPNILYKSVDGWNRLIQSFDVSANTNEVLQYLPDPYNSENVIIQTEQPIKLDDTMIWFGYDVYPITLSLLGFNPVKYFDTTVYDSSLGFRSVYFNSHSDDENTYQSTIAGGNSKTFNKRGSYVITQGSGFIDIDSNAFSYNVSPGQEFHFNTFFNDVNLRSTADTIVKINTLDGSFNYTTYDTSISEESIDSYFESKFITDSSGYKYFTKTNLKYGLTIPTISKWGTSGKDSRGNPVRLMLSNYLHTDPSEANSNFIPVPDSSLYSNELTYPVFKYLEPGDTAWKNYVYYDVNDVVNYNGEYKTIRDLMFEDPYSDYFSKMLYNNNGVSGNASRSSVTYYNLYENKVISILSGLKIGLEVTSTGQKFLNISNWNKYKFSIISSPSRILDHNNPIEVIINENTETILIIWYQGADILHYNKRYSIDNAGKSILLDNPFIPSSSYVNALSGFITGDPSYSFSRAPFVVRTSRTDHPIENIYEKSSVLNYDSSIVSPFAQFNYNFRTLQNSIFNAYDISSNSVAGGDFQFATNSFDTFDQREVDYTFVASSTSFGDNLANVSYSYLNEYNYYNDKTCNIDIFKDIVSRNDVKYYVLSGDNLYTSDSFSSQPISITLYNPIEYRAVDSDSSIYTFNGSYRPLFKDIIKFEDNETSNLIDITKRDFILGNTNIQTFSNIDQYWINRVVENITLSDTSNNIIYKSGLNPFSSLWDNGHFILSSLYADVSIDGYNSDLEQAALFGSKLISLPDEIVLEKWNSTNSKLTTTTENYVLEYNLTESVKNIFISNKTFIDNWSGLPSVSNDIINRYIIKTVFKNYNISFSKIITEVFVKNFDGKILKGSYDSTFSKINNFESELTVNNNNYIYKIKFPKTNNKSYFTKFTFNKK